MNLLHSYVDVLRAIAFKNVNLVKHRTLCQRRLKAMQYLENIDRLGDYATQICAQENNKDFLIGGKASLHTIINSPPALANQKLAATFYTALSYLLFPQKYFDSFFFVDYLFCN